MKRACVMAGGRCSRCASRARLPVCPVRYAVEEMVRTLPMTTAEKREVGFRLRRGMAQREIVRLTGVSAARVRAYAAAVGSAVLP